jgi:hypothetical protein
MSSRVMRRCCGLAGTVLLAVAAVPWFTGLIYTATCDDVHCGDNSRAWFLLAVLTLPALPLGLLLVRAAFPGASGSPRPLVRAVLKITVLGCAFSARGARVWSVVRSRRSRFRRALSLRGLLIRTGAQISRAALRA